MASKKLGLYIHLPFCESKCYYCDFVSYADKEALQGQYVEALLKQMVEYAPYAADYQVDSVYIGGGTPTCVRKELLKVLLEGIHTGFHIMPDAEITCECNPNSSMKGVLQVLKEGGVNRLSFGLQSVIDEELQKLGRLHDFHDFMRAYSDARALGFSNISVDVMFSLPDQTPERLTNTLDTVIRLAPEHVSAYSLKIEQGTPFYRMYKDGELRVPNDEEDRQLYELCVHKLEEAGYGQYEISNFARPGYQSRHNLKYWNCEEYIGLGCNAHSYFGGKRFNFMPEIEVYLNQVLNGGKCIKDLVEIPYEDAVNEYIMMRLRLNEGIDDEVFLERFGYRFSTAFRPTIDKYIATGHMVQRGSCFALTLEGFNISNYIIAEFLEF
ncbi:MAG: radical SAM family heme chaperone HemW [Eubacteriales bacterium]